MTKTRSSSLLEAISKNNDRVALEWEKFEDEHHFDNFDELSDSGKKAAEKLGELQGTRSNSIYRRHGYVYDQVFHGFVTDVELLRKFLRTFRIKNENSQAEG